MEARRKGRHLLWTGAVSFFMLAYFFSGALADIADGVVYTDLLKTVQKGDTTLLKCEFYGDPIAVYWKKGDNPEQGTNLISWVDGGNPSGSCVTDNACDMGDHYSLIIRDARISDQGRYICRVSNYLGILIHNYTDVKIYAPPKEPFPVINECVESESSSLNSTQPCSVLSNGSIVFISCTVKNYYPSLDLFFLHGSQKITDTAANEWTNDDGTKNKTISIEVSASETPYVCVASHIPGSDEQRAATIFVKSLRPTESPITAPQGLPTSYITEERKMDTPNDNKAAKIAVPIVIMLFIVGIGLAMFFAFRRRRQHTGSGGATKIGTEEEGLLLREKAKNSGQFAGDVSFYELWSLAYETREDDRLRIHQALAKLGIKDVTGGLTPANTYDLLCKWKEEHKTEDLAELLREALENADLNSRWVQLCEQRKRTDSKVSHETLEQIILQIENPEKIQQFLGELIPNRPDNMDVKKGGKHIIEEAMKVIMEWSEGPFQENPFPSLSLALERSGCSPLDRIFFGGMVSFFQLWSLSNSMKDDDVKKVLPLFEHLRIDKEDDIKEEELYEFFCSWKDSTKMISQGKTLQDALEKANFKGAWKIIQDIRNQINTRVSVHILEHILWNVNDTKKIDQLLKRLTLDDQETRVDISRGLKDIIPEAMSHLQNWIEQRFNENPLVLLSLALEMAGCSPMDRSFFKVPHELTLEIDKFKIRLFVDRLTSRHIKMLTRCLKISKTEGIMNKENKETLFDTESMISDWIAQEECSNYEKRWKLNKAVNSIDRQDLKDFFGEMKPAIHIGVDYETSADHSKDTVQDGKMDSQTSNFINEEFQRIATYLPQSQLRDLFGDSDDPGSAIQSFAEQRIGKKPKQDWREILRKKLKSVGFQDLIPSELEHSVYLCELLDVAFRLLLEDVYPFAKVLGIPDEKLKDYRVSYAPKHLTKGTTAALIEFSEANKYDRTKVCQALSDTGYTDIAQLLAYGHETSLADEIAIALRADDNAQTLVKISQNLRMSKSGNTDTVLRDWKVMAHPPAYNYRTSLADAVFPVLGEDMAVAILSGKYRASSSESPAVIQAIIRSIRSFKQPLISKILSEDNAQEVPDQRLTAQPKSTGLLDTRRADVNKDLPLDNFNLKSRSPDKEDETGGIDRTDKSAIARRLAQILGIKEAQHLSTQETSTKQVLETWEKKTQPGKIDRRKVSDDLLRAGFKEFAFEVMTGSVPSKKSKRFWKKSKQQKLGKQDQLAESDDTDEQDSDGNDEQDSDDNEEQDDKDDVQPAIKHNGDRVVKTKSSNPSHEDSDVQANIDSDDPGTTGSDDLELKDAGNQASTVGGVPVISDHSDPPIQNNMGSGHTDSGNKPITESVDRAIEDNDQTIQNSNGPDLTDSGNHANDAINDIDKPVIKNNGFQSSKDSGDPANKSSGPRITDSSVKASAGNDEPGIKGSDDLIKPSAIAANQPSKTVVTQPSEATMEDTTQQR